MRDITENHDFLICKQSQTFPFSLPRHYSGSFACTFDVFYYPFDTQRCSVLLQLSSLRLEVARFVGERARVEYLEDKELPSYIVTRYQATDTYRGNNDTRYSVLKVCVCLVLGVCTVGCI